MGDQERIERDSLGAVAVPATALYGIHTVRSLQNLSFSGRPLGSCAPYVRALATVKRAAAIANKDAHVLEARLADAIAAAATTLHQGEHRDHLAVDLLGGGGSIGVHLNVNEVLANLANEALGGRRGDYSPVTIKHVGASQSTADVCHTATRLAVLEEWSGLDPRLRAVGSALRDKQAEWRSVSTLARTCLRDALPVPLGVLFGGFAAACERRTDALAQAVAALTSVALGGTVIGTGSGAPARYRERIVPLLAEMSGLELTSRADAADALQNSDDLSAVSAQLRMIAELLIKLGQDLRLLGSGPEGGFGELIVPAVQEGSSFFAGKSNPVIPETALQCAFQMLACDRAVQAAAERAELYLNVFDGLIAVNVLDAMRMLAGVLPALTERCVRGLVADEERCAQLAALVEK